MHLPHHLGILKETRCNFWFLQITLPNTVLILAARFVSVLSCQCWDPTMATDTQMSPLWRGHHQNLVCGGFPHLDSIRENPKGF